MTTSDFNPRVLVFRFFDLNGLVSFPRFGIEIAFSSLEITKVEIYQDSTIETFDTENQLAVSAVSTRPDQWSVSAQTYDPETYQKFFHLWDSVKRGHAVQVTLFTKAEFEANSGTLQAAPQTLNRAAVGISANGYRDLMGEGYLRRKPFNFTIKRSGDFIYPGQGGGGGGQ